MVAWWDAMTLIEQVFAIIGIASTILLIVQIILLIAGFGGDADADIGGDGGHGGPDAGFDHGSGDLDVASGHADVPDMSSGDWYGGDAHADISGDITSHSTTHNIHDISGTGIHLFTLQGIIAFFAVFGWSGLLMLKSGLHPAASTVVAVVLGFAAMLAIALIFRGMLKLQQDGSMDIRNALGKSGAVYMRVPGSRSNNGKVSIVLQEQLMELDAVTDEAEAIPTGAEVTVIGISNGNTLIVRRK